MPPANAPKLRDSEVIKDSELETRYWPPIGLRLEESELDDYMNSARCKLLEHDAATKTRSADTHSPLVDPHRTIKSEGETRECNFTEQHVQIALDVLYDAKNIDDALERFPARVTALASHKSEQPLLSGVYTFGETRWTAEERATFVKAMRAFPKDFDAIRAAHFTHKSMVST